MGRNELATWEREHGDEPPPWLADDAPLDDGGTRHGSMPGHIIISRKVLAVVFDEDPAAVSTVEANGVLFDMDGALKTPNPVVEEVSRHLSHKAYIPGGFYCTEEDMKPHREREDKLPPLGPGDVKIGDVVTLISGGPRMTVIAITPRIKTDNSKKPSVQRPDGETISCVWFSPSLEGSWTGPHYADFDIRLLDSEV